MGARAENPQSTIARTVEADGIGLHSGAPSRVRLSPASGGGRVFGAPGEAGVEARIGAVAADARATVLGDAERGASLSTVEHLLAALSVAGIDHVRVDVEGGEVPILDGSAAPFVALLTQAGRTSCAPEQVPPAAAPIRLHETVEVREDDRFVRAEPAEAFGLRCAIDFPHPAIGRQAFVCEGLSLETFGREIAPARTFGFLRDLEALRAANLAGGAGLENTLVLTDTGWLNEGGLRFDDEFVRHKALDLVGDLALLGRPLHAFVTAHKAGHRLHHALVRGIESTIASQEREA